MLLSALGCKHDGKNALAYLLKEGRPEKNNFLLLSERRDYLNKKARTLNFVHDRKHICLE